MLSNGNKTIPQWCGAKTRILWNKDKINEYRRRKYAENKEQINQKKREYRIAQKAKNISDENNFHLFLL